MVSENEVKVRSVEINEVRVKCYVYIDLFPHTKLEQNL